MHVIATAGHVDHGKSTLVRALTGMEPDRWAEERRRGMTIGLGFAWTELPSGAAVSFVDVPGHERFVPTMLSGVGPVPAVLLVVAADEGWMPQTAEHVAALDALGVRHGLLVITRSDLMDPELARDETREHLLGTSLAGIDAVAVSARTGDGLDDLRGALDRLLTTLPTPDHEAAPRLWIDRVFTVRGAGTVVTGTLAAGTLAVGDDLAVHPGGRPVTVRALQTSNTATDRVVAVSRVAVNLRGVPADAVHRGEALLRPGTAYPTDLVDVRLRTPGPLPSELTLHIGSAAVPVRVRPLGADVTRLSLATALPLRIGDRALLRDPGARCVHTGVDVLDVAPPPLRRRGAAAARAADLASMTGAPDAAAEVRRRGLVRAVDLAAMGAGVVASSTVVTVGRWLADPALLDARATALRAAVAATDPLEPGLSTEAARRAAGLPDAALLDAVLARPSARGLVHRDGRVGAGDPGLPPTVRAAVDTVLTELRAAPFVAPDADRLAELRLGNRELAAAVRAGLLLRITDGIVLAPGADEVAVGALSELASPFTLAQARQALGTTRRVAVPLLELLGRTGRTRRLPDDTHELRSRSSHGL